MKAFTKRRLSVLLAVLLCLTSIAHYGVPIRAEEGQESEDTNTTVSGNESNTITPGDAIPKDPQPPTRGLMLTNVASNNPAFTLNLGGFDEAPLNLVVEYKYTNEGEGAYRTAVYTPDEDPDFAGNFSGTFELENVPEPNPDPWDECIDIKVTLTSTRIIMACADTGNDNGPLDLSAGIDESGLVLTTHINVISYPWMGISFAYPDAGDPAITETADDFLYAYCPTGGQTVQDLFAEELVCRLMDPSLYDYFGMPEINDNPATRAANVAEMATRIAANGAATTVIAKKTDGTTQSIPVQNYTVNWGNSFEDGSPVTSILPVYTLSDVNDVLICTDFNDSNGSGSKFLICNVENDEIAFSDDAEEPANGIKFLVDSIDPGAIKTGGMGHMATVLNTDGIFTVEVNAGAPASFLRVHDPASYVQKIRLLNTSVKYVSVKGSGETNAYGLIGDNGSTCDSVWAAGDNKTATARVYVGDTTIHVHPLSGATGASTSITSVQLADSTQVDGVTLNATNPTDVTLSFTSNFYDEVPLKITFAGGAVKYLTITRVGLVIQYQYLGGDPNGPNPGGLDHGEIIQDYYGDTIGYDYNYFGDGAGNGAEQIAVWATYYHPTNDPTGGASDYVLYLTFDNGSHRVVTATDTAHNFNGRLAAKAGAVASTSYLIGFEKARMDFDGNVWTGQLDETNYHEGGFYATVLNAGYDDNTTYSGTQMGSGKGVHWDGHISFYN